MNKGITSTGFEFEISPTVINDYELVEQLADLEENPLILTKVIVRILGKEQAEKLKNHVREESGIVPTDKMTKEIIDIFQSGEQTKNS